MRDLAYKHFFTIKYGRFAWDDPQMFEYKKRQLEGKRGYAIIEEEVDKASRNELAYYFGGIIRRECMRSNIFGGLKEKEIHNILLFETRGTVRNIAMPDGTTKVMECIPDFEEITRDKAEMAKYISEVIAKLQVDFDIHPKPASHYKQNRFYIDTQHFK
jgi:hypothetical protein